MTLKLSVPDELGGTRLARDYHPDLPTAWSCDLPGYVSFGCMTADATLPQYHLQHVLYLVSKGRCGAIQYGGGTRSECGTSRAPLLG